MSAAGRGPRGGDGVDFFETPEWCVTRLLEAIGHELAWDAHWLEPSCGTGAIVRAVEKWPQPAPPLWTACDLTAREGLDTGIFWSHRAVRWRFLCCDFAAPLLSRDVEDRRYSVAIGNPPYSLAFDFVQRAYALASEVIFLLRLNFLEGEARAEWMRAHTPSVYVLPNRPSFDGEGTDATGYAWFRWRHDGSAPVVKILDSTPPERR